MPSGIVDRPAKHAVRLVALGFLGEAETARRALLEGSDPEALHDVRVALRRLRSCLRSYAPLLGESIRKKDRRRLKSLAAATGEARDLEVQLERLSRLEALTDEEERAVGWLVRQREEAKRAADDDVQRTIEDGFPKARARLERRLARYELEIDPAHPDVAPPSYAFAAAGVITILGARIEARLADVRGEADQRTAHDARIAGKRLRYVLEPLRGDVPAAIALVAQLKTLQDLLGDMHDADVLCNDIEALLAAPSHAMGAPPEDGLRALHDRFESERGRLYEQARDEWLGTAAAPFLDAVRRLARQLRTRGAGDVEIERKYLLDGMPRMGRKHVRRLRIDQGWLPGERLRERLRRVRGPHGTRWFRTVKSGHGIRRFELEEETTGEIFQRLWRLTAGRRVYKRRYLREHDGLVWEIDFFTDRDLVLAEVELPATDTPITFPPWLAPHVVREVTDDPEYVNANLAR